MALTKTQAHIQMKAVRDRTRDESSARSESDVRRLLTSIESLAPGRAILLICLLAFLAYANSIGGEFVFDDSDQIVNNQDIRSWTNLTKAFTTHVWAFRDRQQDVQAPPPLPYYRPVFTVMLTVEYHLFGLWPQGWHLVSLLLHILSSVGVFYVLLLMSHRMLLALLAACLFAVHPVHAESVSWISGMTDPLFGVFFLASFYFYLKSRAASVPVRQKRTNSALPDSRRTFVLSLALFVAACFSKETALSLVLLVFGYEVVETQGSWSTRASRAVRQALPYAAVALLYLVPRYLVLGEFMWKNPQAPDRPFSYTLLTLPFVGSSYLFHLAWPVGLSVTYQTHFITSIASGSFLLPTLALLLLASALLLYRKRVSHQVWQALLMIVVPLLPVLNLGQVAREEYLVFDHYLYLSVAGWAYLIAFGFGRLAAIGSAKEMHAEKPYSANRRTALAVAAMVSILLALTAATAKANMPWADSYSLWANAARVRPSYWATHYNAGLALLEAKRFDEARDALDRAVELKLDEPDVFDALGRANDAMGDTAAAVASFKRAIELNPETFESLNNLGTVYFKSGNYVAAENHFVVALAVKPHASATLFNLGLCYSRQGRSSDAIRQLERVCDLGPADDETYYELGLAYEKAGRLADAIGALNRAREIARSQALADKASERLSEIQTERKETYRD